MSEKKKEKSTSKKENKWDANELIKKKEQQRWEEKRTPNTKNKQYQKQTNSQLPDATTPKTKPTNHKDHKGMEGGEIEIKEREEASRSKLPHSE